MAATAKVIELKGNPKNPESAEHIIKFPGGSIAVCRTTNNKYWAHIEVYDGKLLGETVRESAQGRIVETRLDYTDRAPIGEILEPARISHIAVLIETKGGE